MKLIMKHEEKTLKNSILAEHIELIYELNIELKEYRNMNLLDWSDDQIIKLTEQIIYITSTDLENYLPIQSFIGMLVGFVANDTFESKAENTVDLANAIVDIWQQNKSILYSILDIELTKNNYLRVKSKIFNSKYQYKTYIGFKKEPFKQQIKFGSYDFKINKKGEWYKAQQILKNTPFKIRGLECDKEPQIIKGYTPEALKSQEAWRQWQVRQKLLADFENKKLYTNWGPDYRGRLYSIGYAINIQGDKMQRYHIVGAKAEYLTKEGFTALQIMLADAYGIDKLTIAEKLKWFRKNEWRINKLKKAENPIEWEYHLRAYNKYINGEKVDELCSLDVAQSQFANSAILFKSKSIAKKVGLAPVYKEGSKFQQIRPDVWNEFARYFNNFFNTDIFHRKHFKRAAMVTGYGAGKKRLKQVLISKDGLLGLLESLAVNESMVDEIVDEWFDAYETIIPGYLSNMRDINELWGLNGAREQINFTTASNFKVTAKEMNTDIISYKIADFEHKSTVEGVEATNKSLLPFVTLLHSIDATILHKIVVRCAEENIEVLTIHDAFLTSYNHYFKVQNIYKKVMCEMLNQPLLENFLKESFDLKLPKGVLEETLTEQDILKSNYSLS